MGIKLDWEVEEDDGWDEVPEDQALAAARRARRRRLLNIALGVIALIALAALAVTARLRQVSAQLQTQLESTVDAETLALRLGSRSAFLALQAEGDDWRSAQSATFDAYQALAPRLDVRGEVIASEIDGETARVTLREVLDGQPYQVTWFYEHTRQGWQHAPPPAAAWGERLQSTSGEFVYSYYEADSDFVQALMPRLEGWWQQACELTGCHPSPRTPVHVVVHPDPLTGAGWSADGRARLSLPSPLFGRLPEGGQALGAEATATVTRAIAGRWAQALTYPDRWKPPNPSSDLPWVQAELAVWLQHKLDESAPASGFFSPLEDEFGPGFMPAFIEAIRRDDRLVPALQAVTGVSAADLPVDWTGYIAYRLREEARLLDAQDHEAARLYREPGSRRQPEGVIDEAIEAVALPGSIEVIGVEPAGDVLLAEVRFERRFSGRDEPVAVVGFEPFRWDAGGLLHTRLEFRHWGEERTAASEHFDLVYYERDAAAVGGLLEQMERDYATLSAALSLPAGPEPRMLAFVTPLEPGAFFAQRPPIYFQGYDALFSIDSPYATLRAPGVTMQQQVRAEAAWRVIGAVMNLEGAPIAPGDPLSRGFMIWALDELGVEPGHLSPAEEAVFDVTRAEQVLFELLVYHYGLAGALERQQALAGAEDLDDWLRGWLDIAEADAFRAELENCYARRPACPLDG